MRTLEEHWMFSPGTVCQDRWSAVVTDETEDPYSLSFVIGVTAMNGATAGGRVVLTLYFAKRRDASAQGTQGTWPSRS